MTAREEGFAAVADDDTWTGDQHYRQGEKILWGRNGHYASFGCKSPLEAIALAHAHFAAAQAAATLDAAFVRQPPGDIPVDSQRAYVDREARGGEGYGA